MNIIAENTINVPIDKIWDIAAVNFADAHLWASTLEASMGSNEQQAPLAGAPCSKRVCHTNNGMGGFTETLTRYDEMEHVIAYTAKGDKMPGFVKHVENTWKITSISPSQTKVRMHVVMKVSFPFNIMMGWMMKMQFKKVMKQSLDDLNFFAENGEPHPRKIKAEAKLQKKAA